LIDEPYVLPLEQIVELTPRQLDWLYFAPRDKKTGARKQLPYLFDRGLEGQLEAKAQFLSMGLALGHKIDDLEREWAKQYGDSDGR
jgi:hypothetical protein